MLQNTVSSVILSHSFAQSASVLTTQSSTGKQSLHKPRFLVRAETEAYSVETVVHPLSSFISNTSEYVVQFLLVLKLSSAVNLLVCT